MAHAHHHGWTGKLIRGEIAAVEAYQDALEHVDGDDPATRILAVLAEEHRRARAALEGTVGSPAATEEDGAGPWGAFTRAVETVARWVGDRTALKALKEGEVHGASEYRSALASDDLPAPVRTLVADELLPAQERHVATLDELVAALEAPDRLSTLEARVRNRARG